MKVHVYHLVLLWLPVKRVYYVSVRRWPAAIMVVSDEGRYHLSVSTKYIGPHLRNNILSSKIYKQVIDSVANQIIHPALT